MSITGRVPTASQDKQDKCYFRQFEDGFRAVTKESLYYLAVCTMLADVCVGQCRSGECLVAPQPLVQQ